MIDSSSKEPASIFNDRFPFPPPSDAFDRVEDASFWSRMLAQEVGSWDITRAPETILVAGCGTVQAVRTALKFPQSRVHGIDVSANTVEISRAIARALKLENLSFSVGSIIDDNFDGPFDYILCTGVIHHTTDPLAALQQLSRRLKPDGLMELMVYNFYHRVRVRSVQDALRLLVPSSDMDEQLSVARLLASELPERAQMLDSALQLGAPAASPAVPESVFADRFIQPVECSYTIETFHDLCEQADLIPTLPCINWVDRQRGKLFWSHLFRDPEVRARYARLSPRAQWQVTNLIETEDSPRIWFYLRRKESQLVATSEQRLCTEFLELEFRQTHTTLHRYRRGADGSFLPDEPRPFPGAPVPAELRRVWQAVKPGVKMAQVFAECAIPRDFDSVNRIRVQLTTSEFPFLEVRR